MKKFNIIVIGAGLYVCGKGTSGYGTILPAIFEWKRHNVDIGDIHCVSTYAKSSKELLQKVKGLEIKTGIFELMKRPENSQIRYTVCSLMMVGIKKKSVHFQF